MGETTEQRLERLEATVARQRLTMVVVATLGLVMVSGGSCVTTEPQTTDVVYAQRFEVKDPDL